ncbi:HD family phosphohydrolase [Roseimaritima sediminicola]|uniref:HD family phosphohydrolase n=1 Tax=Roseimaritima sediminicola TaxID=2662066 RepID=UPI001298453F|nr:HDIG domain-containing metalloprotein [Roseimaritima sediminicola]
MNGNPPKRTRSERAQSLGTQPPRLRQWLHDFFDLAVWTRLSIAAAAALLMLLVCQTWKPPFAYRIGFIPPRDMVARVDFEFPDINGTQLAQARKRAEVVTYYRNDSQPLDQLRETLKNQLFVILDAASHEQMTPEQRQVFEDFWLGDETSDESASAAAQFAALKSSLATDSGLTALDAAVKLAMADMYAHGLLQVPAHKIDEGNQRVLYVYPVGRPEAAEQIEVSAVRIAEAREQLASELDDSFRSKFAENSERYQTAAKMVTHWLQERLPVTLIYDAVRSEQAREQAAREVGTVMTPYRSGITPIAKAGSPIEAAELELLRAEWSVLTDQMSWGDRLLRMGAYLGMIIALYLLCGCYIYFIDDRQLLTDPYRLSLLLGFMVMIVAFCHWTAREQWQATTIPLVIGAITAAVVYGRELALLLLASVCLAVTLFNGSDLADLVSLAAAATSCILLLGRLRSRTRLLYLGVSVAAVVAATVVGVGIVTGQSLSAGNAGPGQEALIRSTHLDDLLGTLFREAVWVGGCVIVSCLSMTGLLPLVERVFGVQTDLSLLELGDAGHPLLRQLAQRAPGTYNHSINVASIGEAAADAIGANGLLVRVGAYFHDIGKMFKPNYFIENQGQGPNQHDSLQPAMSTLVIIAHVKDGADLARTHHLPEPIIDFILQHHGTTLVEYFYREAAKRSEEDPNGEEVSDKDFRYPGPKPQTLEAAVMMLADTVESASRTLVDPTPARIKSLVDAIAMKKLSDGQFDECGLTLLQLDRIKQSLVKSLTAIYHARVKYPGQQSA